MKTGNRRTTGKLIHRQKIYLNLIQNVELIERNFEVSDIGWENNSNERGRDDYNKNASIKILYFHVLTFRHHFTFRILYLKQAGGKEAEIVREHGVEENIWT